MDPRPRHSLRIVDAHHHLWDPADVDYALLRLDGPLRPLARAFRAEMFDEVAGDHGVTAAIAVEATSAGADPEAETDWLLRQVARSSVTRSAVCWAPIDEPARLPAHLDALEAKARARGVALVGVRRSFETVPAGFALQPPVAEGIRAVAARGLVVDLVLFGDRLAEMVELVRRVPEARFVLDHLGKPRMEPRSLVAWQGQVEALGRLPNVWAKVSGLATEAHSGDWETLVRPLVTHATGVLGWARCMFASDWPVCQLAGGYGRWLAFVSALAAEASADERTAFFAATAEHVYGLRPAAGRHPMGTA